MHKQEKKYVAGSRAICRAGAFRSIHAPPAADPISPGIPSVFRCALFARRYSTPYFFEWPLPAPAAATTWDGPLWQLYPSPAHSTGKTIHAGHRIEQLKTASFGSYGSIYLFKNYIV